jgi:hypothetical protein
MPVSLVLAYNVGVFACGKTPHIKTTVKFCSAELQRIFSFGKNVKEQNHEQNDN